MSETLSRLRRQPNKYLAVVAGTTALAFTGCGGNSFSADKKPLGTCGKKDYNRPSALAVSSKNLIIAQAAKRVLLLQDRALSNGGSIDLPLYRDLAEIRATDSRLTLAFRRSTELESAKAGDGAVDHVSFTTAGNTTHISSGAVMCFDHNASLVANGTYATLKLYTHLTDTLGNN